MLKSKRKSEPSVLSLNVQASFFLITVGTFITLIMLYANIIASLTGDRRVVAYVVKCLPARGIFSFHSQPEKAAGQVPLLSMNEWVISFIKLMRKKNIFSDNGKGKHPYEVLQQPTSANHTYQRSTACRVHFLCAPTTRA